MTTVATLDKETAAQLDVELCNKRIDTNLLCHVSEYTFIFSSQFNVDHQK